MFGCTVIFKAIFVRIVCSRSHWHQWHGRYIKNKKQLVKNEFFLFEQCAKIVCLRIQRLRGQDKNYVNTKSNNLTFANRDYCKVVDSCRHANFELCDRKSSQKQTNSSNVFVWLHIMWPRQSVFNKSLKISWHSSFRPLFLQECCQMLIYVKRLSPPTDFEGNQPASSTIFFVPINQKKM